jgi:hypothetical protein
MVQGEVYWKRFGKSESFSSHSIVQLLNGQIIKSSNCLIDKSFLPFHPIVHTVNNLFIFE